MKILKLFLKVAFLLHASCKVTTSHPRNRSTHIRMPTKPFKPSLVSPSSNGDLEFQVEMQILFIVLVHFPAMIRKYVEQENCIAICLPSGTAFLPPPPSGESGLLLNSPCSQRSSPAFGPEGTCRGSAASVLYFRRLYYMLPS